MLVMLTGNLGTIVVALFLVMVVAFIVRTMIRDKKQGKTSCGGNCTQCKMCSSCQRKQ